jgi:DNA-binding CsgD family transcriptional regulator
VWGVGSLDSLLALSYWQTQCDPCAEQLAVSLNSSAETGQAMRESNYDLPKPRELESFLEDQALMPRTLYEAAPAFQQFCVPCRIRSQQALRVYHNGRYLNLVGLLRKDGTPLFTRRDRKRLAPLVEATKNALLAAEGLEQANIPQGPAYLFAEPDGRVEYASEGARGWLSQEGFPQHLARAVRQLDQQKLAELGSLLAHAEARLVRMEGEGRIRYLVSLRPLKRCPLPADIVLTPKQRDIAIYAASGATAEEVGRAVGCAPNTVRTHLREIYKLLNVGNRLELARALSVSAKDQ